MSEDIVGSKHSYPVENILNNRTRKLLEKEEEKCPVSGYGSQMGEQHPFYRTTSKEYGWFPPDGNTAPSVYFPTRQTFSSYLAAAGMYRNHSLNTSMDPPQYN